MNYSIPKTARVAVLTAPKKIEILTLPVPEIGDDEVLVKVEQTGICGTDVHEYKGDPGSGWGTNEGRIKAMDMTMSNGFTENGKLKVYVSEAKFTGEPIEKAFFGCGGVAEIPDLQNKLIRLARGGFKHHTIVGVGHMKDVLTEAFKTYLGYEVINIDYLKQEN